MTHANPFVTRQNKALNTPRRRLLQGVLAATLATAAATGLLVACGGDADHGKAKWSPRKTVIVILENRSFKELIGSTEMPYLNQLATKSALLTQSYAAPTPYNLVPTGGAPKAADPTQLSNTTWTMGSRFTQPLPARGSQTNYFYQFAGHNQGFLPDWFQQPGSGRKADAAHPAYQDQFGNTLVDAAGNPAPSFTGEIGLSNELVTSFPNVSLPFTTPNLGAALIDKGHGFATFSESLPYPSYNEKAFNPTGVPDGYARRHNPAINWINFAAYGKQVDADKLRFTLPLGTNLAMMNTVDPDGTKYPGFAVDADGKPRAFDALPTVSLVVPNNMDNIHTGTLAAADAWLKTHIQPYADWAVANDALLIITTDEDGFTNAANGVANVGTDTLIAQYYPGKGGSYMFGMDPITTLLFGPPQRVKTGTFATRVDHLGILATVLDMYDALEQFKVDFNKAWSARVHPINAQWVGGENPVRQQELKAQLAGLVPLTGVFAN